MGCCCCCAARLEEILDDPTIQLKAEVGDIAIVQKHYHSQLAGPCVRGAMYVQDGALRYRPACGRTFCCSSCYRVYQLSSITKVELLEHQTVSLSTTSQYRQQPVRCGLKISLNTDTVIVVVMSEAPVFGPRLRTLCGLSKEEF